MRVFSRSAGGHGGEFERLRLGYEGTRRQLEAMEMSLGDLG
jgi:hypothetical protein